MGLLLSLSGCAWLQSEPGGPTIYVPQRIEVIVPVPCVHTLPPVPQYRSDLVDGKPWDLIAIDVLLDIDAAKLDAARLRAALTACATAP